jgi:metal-dependent hydrolase (beta-lactamase superfamily II)
MIRFTNNPANLLKAVSEDIFNHSQSKPHDFVIVCEHGEIVKTHKYAFGILSSSLRSVIGSLPIMDGITLIIPDIKRVSMEMVVKMMMFGWNEEEEFGKDVVNVLKLLNINAGE